MTADDLGDLHSALGEAIAILADAGQEHWRAWLEQGRRQLAADEAGGLDHLLGAYGGMGSFNDVIVSAARGRSGTAYEFRDVNDRLAALRSQIYSCCTRLKG